METVETAEHVRVGSELLVAGWAPWRPREPVLTFDVRPNGRLGLRAMPGHRKYVWDRGDRHEHNP